ncbi:MAG: TRAP transporter small permease [Myxococcales bacterium]|nr:TRAP transporter small permease [Myxococcales bacterium]
MSEEPSKTSPPSVLLSVGVGLTALILSAVLIWVLSNRDLESFVVGLLLCVPFGVTCGALVGVVLGSGSTETVETLGAFDDAIGAGEQTFVTLALMGLLGVGTYQFLSSNFLGASDTWPAEALKYLVFFCAMGGASLSAQKGRMISMDFLARKLAPKKRVILRILVAGFVIFACVLLSKGGMFVRAAASKEMHYEVLRPSIALLALPIGAGLIGFHYLLHAITDALYLSAGLIPPEEEGPAAH